MMLSSLKAFNAPRFAGKLTYLRDQPDAPRDPGMVVDPQADQFGEKSIHTMIMEGYRFSDACMIDCLVKQTQRLPKDVPVEQYVKALINTQIEEIIQRLTSFAWAMKGNPATQALGGLILKTIQADPEKLEMEENRLQARMIMADTRDLYGEDRTAYFQRLCDEPEEAKRTRLFEVADVLFQGLSNRLGEQMFEVLNKDPRNARILDSDQYYWIPSYMSLKAEQDKPVAPPKAKTRKPRTPKSNKT